MCAIAGIFQVSDPLAGRADLSVLLTAMRHRGPDDSGVYIDECAGVALGHNRLSIIDLGPGGRQPMVNPDTGDVLVFNGEIYNFCEIRDELVAKGTTFKTRSDTEVLLKGFEVWGANCLDHVKGMYAFAIWRPREQTLFLARDPMGIKPLYYCTRSDGSVVFASEVRALRALPSVSAGIDRAALGQFLEFGYAFEDKRTIFTNVSKLAPGHIAALRRDATPAVRRFFNPNVGSKKQRPRIEIEEELFTTLDCVVTQHLNADVPVGLLLSGGIDSGLIAALAARKTSLRTLTLAFGDSAIDERADARRVADFVKSQHEEIVISADELRDELDDGVSLFDDIFGDWGTLSTRLLYKRARERGLKVMLVGEGADELFGGYEVFRMSASRSPTEVWLFQLYRRYAGRRYGGFYSSFRRIMHGYLRDVNGDRFDAIRLFESRNQLPTNYVMKVDKASMSVGVEARVPFLDQRVAEIAYRIHSDALLTPSTEKKLLRDMARRRGLLPQDCFQRKKFGAPIAASWMDDHASFRAFARDVILARGGWTEALGFRSSMEDYFLRNRSGRGFPHAIAIFRNLAWRLLLLELWSQAMGLRASAN